MTDQSASAQIDYIIELHSGWKADVLTQVRTIIQQADPEVVEEVKWKMPSLPEGRPVWSDYGILCLAEVFKNDIKLVFVKGAQLDDTYGLFNARLNSKTDRAIEFRQDSQSINQAALTDLIHQAIELNKAKTVK